MTIRRLGLLLVCSVMGILGIYAQDSEVTATFKTMDMTGQYPYVLFKVNGATYNKVWSTSNVKIYKDGSDTPLMDLEGADYLNAANSRNYNNDEFYIYPPTPITAEGEYTFVIAAGSVSNQQTGEYNPELTFTARIGEDEPVVIEAAVMECNLTKAESPNVVIGIAGGSYTRALSSARVSIFPKGESTPVSVMEGENALSPAGNICTLYAESPITQEGTYRVLVKSYSMMNMTTFDVNPEFEFEVEVEKPAVVITATVVDNQLASDIPYVLISLEGGTYNRLVSTAKVEVYRNDETEPISVTTGGDALYPEGSQCYVYVEDRITSPGIYRFVVAENSMRNSATDETNPEFSFIVEIGGGMENTNVTITPDPDNVVSVSTGVTAFNIAFEGYAFTGDTLPGAITINKDGSLFATVDSSNINRGMDNQGAFVNLPANAIMQEEGDYEVVVPSGIMLWSNETSTVVNPDVSFTYMLRQPTGKLSWTVSPAPGTVDQLDVVTFNFNKAVKQGSYNKVQIFCTESFAVDSEVTEGTIKVADDGMSMTITYSPVMRLGGIWDVKVISRGDLLYIADGEEFEGISEVYKIDGEIPVTLEPAAATNCISNVRVYFPYPTGIASTDSFKAWFEKGDRKVNATFVEAQNRDFEHKAFVELKADEDIVETGTWTLVIARGSLEMSSLGESLVCGEIRQNMEVKGGYVVTVTPADGSEIDRFDDFRLSFANAESITVDNSVPATLQYRYYTFWLNIEDVVCTSTVEDGEVVIAVEDELKLLQALKALAGRDITYRLIIPDGNIIVNGFPWPGATIHYSYELPEWTIYPYPQSKVTRLDDIYIEYNGEGTASAVTDMIPMTFQGKDYPEYAILSGQGPWSVEFQNPCIVSGIWGLNLSGIFQVDGADAGLGWISYDVNDPNVKVEELGTTAGQYTVFTPTGVCVLKNGSRENLSTLLPGLYIINGKKQLITNN